MTRKSQKSLEVEDATLELQFKVRRNTFEKSTVDLFSYYVVEQPNGCLKHHDINSFKYYLCKKLHLSIYDGFSYVDRDGDVIYIESQDTFEDVMKFTRARNKRNKRVLLIVEPGARHSECSEEFCLKDVRSISESNNFSKLKSISTVTESMNMMAPSTVNDIVEEVDNMALEGKLNNSDLTLPVSSDATPPAWFKEYMEMLKKDIVAQVSSEVMSSVTEILNKRSSEKLYYSHNHFSEDNSRHSRDIYSEESQYKKKKRVVDEMDSNYALPSYQQQNIQMREVESVKKCEQELKSELNNKLELLEQKMCNILKKKKHCAVAAIVDDLDSDNVRMKFNNRECNVIKDSATIVVPESVFPLRSESKYDDDRATNVTSQPDTKLHMNCSITGRELFEKTNIKDTEYYSDFDADDISVISDISHMSSMEQDSFEIIPMPSCIVGKSDNCDSNDVNDLEINENTSVASNDCKDNVNVDSSETENDRNNNTGSPTFEMLSGPISPAESIHVVENYFTMNKSEIDESASSDDLIDFKNEFMFETNIPYMNVRGKMFEDISVDDYNKTTSVKQQDKRPKVTYAYITETLLGHKLTKTSPVYINKMSSSHDPRETCPINIDKTLSSHDPEETSPIHTNETLSSHDPEETSPIYMNETSPNHDTKETCPSNIDETLSSHDPKETSPIYTNETLPNNDLEEASPIYINDTLPNHDPKETCPMSKSETIIEELSEDNCNDVNADEKFSHPSYTTNADTVTSSTSLKTRHVLRSQTDLNDVSHVSTTQSFSSHTTSDAGNTSTKLDSGYKHVIVDHNVSKGLGKIIYSPLATKRSCVRDNKKAARINYGDDEKCQNRYTSKDYVGFSMGESKELIGDVIGRRKVSSDARLSSGEPVNVLPELLVSGVEQVASSVCSTARRVLSKMRNVQTGEDTNRLRTGW